jgi:hypothetical protein
MPLELYELVLMRPGQDDEVVSLEYAPGLEEGDTFDDRDGVKWVVLELLGLPEVHKDAVYRLACRVA